MFSLEQKNILSFAYNMLLMDPPPDKGVHCHLLIATVSPSEIKKEQGTAINNGVQLEPRMTAPTIDGR